jgi:hypothetical protein
MTTWNYRVMDIRHNDGSGGVETIRAIHEVYYNEHGEPISYTLNPVQVLTVLETDSPNALMETLDKMREALSKPVMTPVDFHSQKAP